MKVICYMQPHRGGGIGRHGIEMVRRLLRYPGISGKIVASRWQVQNNPRFADEMAGLPIETHWFPEMSLERSWKLVSWPQLPCEQTGFDIVYGPAEVRFPRSGIPNMVTVHDAQAFESDLPWSRTLEHRLFRAKWLYWLPKVCREASCVVTVSEYSRQRLSEVLQIDPARICVVGNGVSDVFFRGQQDTTVETDNTIVIIGGLRTKKGAAATLAVAERLRLSGSPLVIEIYGQHDREWASRAGRYSNVRLFGYVSDAVLASKLKKAVALLFLSLYEGFGIPAIEAMAAGTPAVVSNRASLPEIVGQAGIQVNDEAPETVADVLEQLRTDMAMRQALIAKGFARASDFTWDACVDRLVSAMTRIVRPDCLPHDEVASGVQS